MTTNEVLNVPTDPHLTVIGHLPAKATTIGSRLVISVMRCVLLHRVSGMLARCAHFPVPA